MFCFLIRQESLHHYCGVNNYCQQKNVIHYQFSSTCPVPLQDIVGKLAVRGAPVPALLCLWFTEGDEYLSRQYSVINAEVENMGTDMPKKPVEGRYCWVLQFKKSLLKVSSRELENLWKFVYMWFCFSLIKARSHFICICIKCIMLCPFT